MTNTTEVSRPLAERFEEYHAANPHIFELLVKYTRHLIESGRTGYGINGVFERIRWHMDVETKDPDGYKMNNNYRAKYVRLLESEYPEFVGFYKKRRLRSEDQRHEITGLVVS